MRRTTFIGGLLAGVLVIGYGGWLSNQNTGDTGSGGDQSSQTDKPGEAPKN